MGVAINAGVNKLWDMDEVKQKVADGFNTFPGILENGKKIVSVGAKKTKKKFGTIVSHVSNTVSKAIQDTKKNVKGFFDGLFGGDE